MGNEQLMPDMKSKQAFNIALLVKNAEQNPSTQQPKPIYQAPLDPALGVPECVTQGAKDPDDYDRRVRLYLAEDRQRFEYGAD